MRARRSCITYIDLWGRVAAVDIELGAQSCLANVSVAPGDDAGDTGGVLRGVPCGESGDEPGGSDADRNTPWHGWLMLLLFLMSNGLKYTANP